MSTDETPADVGDLARAVSQAREDLSALGRTLTTLRCPLALGCAAESFESVVWTADRLGAGAE